MTNRSSDIEGSVVDRLRSQLGDKFVDWILGGLTAELDSGQPGVITFLSSLIHDLPADSDRSPIDLLAPLLLEFDEGSQSTVLNLLRQQATGQRIPDPRPTGDDVLDRLLQTARDVYGSLLLTDDLMECPSPSDPFVRREVSDAVLADPRLPFLKRGIDSAEQWIRVYSSTGEGGGLRAVDVGPRVLSTAWSIAYIDGGIPTLDRLMHELEWVLTQLRCGLRHKAAQVVGLASLTGLVLPENTILDLGWGRIRPVTDRHLPMLFNHIYSQGKLTRETPDGATIVISDGGEIVLEAVVPFSVHLGEFDTSGGDWPMTLSSTFLAQRTSQVRLAHILASADDIPAVLLPSWHRFIDPLSQLYSLGSVDPRFGAPREPILLTEDDVERWLYWIKLLDDHPVSALGVAPDRLLRAASERRDPSDALIDSVIAWEALFGGGSEAVLRVSLSMARLLREAGKPRRTVAREIRELYDVRSRVVHGQAVDSQEIWDASRRALQLTIETFRKLVQQRPDLLIGTGGERSSAILQE